MGLEAWKSMAQALKRDIYALYLAYKDPRVPWYAKLWIVVVVAYAFSPIDLIPDFIPILGYLDDVILLPLGILLAVKMIPAEVMTECRAKSADLLKRDRPKNWIVAAVIVGLWALMTWAVVHFLIELISFN